MPDLIQKLEDLKVSLDEIQQEALVEVPSEILPQISETLENVRTSLNDSASVLEQHYQDIQLSETLKKDLLQQMKEDDLYNVPEDKQLAITDSIIDSDDKHLLSSEEFKDYITKHLRGLEDEELVTKAYSKQDIIQLGEAVVDSGVNEQSKYDAGIEVLLDMVQTPTGRDDALAHGEERILENSSSRLYHLYEYYEVL